MKLPAPIRLGIFSLAVLLVGLNAALLRQNRKLDALNKAHESSSHLNVGDTVPLLDDIGDAGQPLTLDYPSGQQKTLLLVFSPSCVECTLNWPNWHKLLGQVDNARTRILGVTFKERGLSQNYVSQAGLPEVQEVLMPDPQSVIMYRFRLTPQTILIGPSQW